MKLVKCLQSSHWKVLQVVHSSKAFIHLLKIISKKPNCEVRARTRFYERRKDSQCELYIRISSSANASTATQALGNMLNSDVMKYLMEDTLATVHDSVSHLRCFFISSCAQLLPSKDNCSNRKRCFMETLVHKFPTRNWQEKPAGWAGWWGCCEWTIPLPPEDVDPAKSVL